MRKSVPQMTIKATAMARTRRFTFISGDIQGAHRRFVEGTVAASRMATGRHPDRRKFAANARDLVCESHVPPFVYAPVMLRWLCRARAFLAHAGPGACHAFTGQARGPDARLA